MRLYEYEAKEIFKRFGIPIPRGRLAKTPAETRDIAVELGKPVLLKAQILAGGRGKAGGVQIATNPDEAEEVALKLFGQRFLGIRVDTLLVEERLDVERELYLAVVIDDRKGMPVLMVSSEGGVKVEEIAEDTPEKIVLKHIDILRGLRDYEAKEFVRKLGITDSVVIETGDILWKLYNVFRAYHAEIAEINPLIITKDWKAVAADAKLNIEEHSLFRHPEFESLKLERIENFLEREGQRMGVNYVDLKGSLALAGNGAGLVMTLIDVVKQAGGEVACFLDTGGGLSANRMENAMKLLLKKVELDLNVKAIFFIFQLMISPPDELAKGILSVLSKEKPRIPIIGVITGRTGYVKSAYELLGGSVIKLYPTMEEG
ncbi:acetate--CoA ligase family protein, partial [Candidatus Bathyarchaeota archaeon]|nr:acetate--CoA ligase family protein [Candidatus Bathyarchaeota archaeon]